MNPATTLDATTDRTAKTRRFEGLDLLRLVAALAVVVYHYTFRGAAGDDPLTIVSIPAMIPFAKYGYLGVEMFFVISGFVISFSAGNRSAKDFAFARACRLYPAYLFCMTITFLFTLTLGGAVFQASLGKWLANAAMVTPALSWRLLMDGAYWSIFAEMVFYAWVTGLIATGLFARHLTATMLVWLLVSAANQFVFGSVLAERLLLTEHSAFFAAGVMLYVLRGRSGGLGSIAVLVLATALAVPQALKGTLFSIATLHTELNMGVVAAVAVGSIVLVAAVTSIRRLPVSSAWVGALGGLTYPLYLMHAHVGYMIFNRLGGRLPSTMLVSLVMIAMIAASYLIWRFVDRPGQRLMRKAVRSIDEAVVSPGLHALRLRLRGESVASFSSRQVALERYRKSQLGTARKSVGV